MEGRIVGALLLVIACAIAMQAVSQERGMRVRADSEALGAATTRAELAGQLARTVNVFRLVSYRYLDPAFAEEATSDGLTDAAMSIGDRVNALQMSGGNLYASAGASEFGEIDRLVGDIIVARDPAATPTRRAALDRRTDHLSAMAARIEQSTAADRDAALEAVIRSTRDWQRLVAVCGMAILAVVLAMLFDLLRHIIPSVRRMHATLRRLADGELDGPIEDFHLTELRALSGPLEKFRKNALAVRDLAFTDPATGLPNRRAFVDRATRRLKASSETHIVMLADVDRFKFVNDEYGHAAGDCLVARIAERMVEHLGDGAIVARVGGDEFAILVPLPAARTCPAIAEALVAAIRKPFALKDCTIATTISLGYVETWGKDPDIAGLLLHADLALYAAKNDGRNRSCGYSHELGHERGVSRAIERDLASALETDQLRMVYQPILAFARDPVADQEVEALVRWIHPTLGEISPASFIPAAERSGLMVRLGCWIIEQSLSDLARWPALTMSINLSPLQLQQEGFARFLLDACRRNGIVARRVFLEVTESLSIERNTRAIMTLNLLRSMGFRIALDDFGTGYSSLCMMKTFRFDRLKLDRSLISDLSSDPTSQAVFDAAVTMALRIGAEVVAEGISEAELIAPVQSAGCTHVQGFYYSHPIEADAVASYYGEGAAQQRRVA